MRFKLVLLLLVLFFAGSDLLAKDKEMPVSVLFGMHQSKNTGIEIGISRNVGMGTTGKNIRNNTWSYTYSLSTEMYFGDNSLLAPKVAVWLMFDRLKHLSTGASAFYMYNLAGGPAVRGVRPEVSFYFRVSHAFRKPGLYFRRYRCKLVYGYNFSSDAELTGRHQVSLVFFRTSNAFHGKKLK